MRIQHAIFFGLSFLANACAPAEVSSRAQSLTDPGPSATSTTTDALDAEETAFLGLINGYRQQNGLTALALNTTLIRAAAWLSEDMAAKNYVSHTDSLGRSAFTRIAAFGYTGGSMAENIAAGNAGAQGTFDQWKASAGHNANMLSTTAKAIGIARAYGAGSTYGWYWTNTFGSAL